MESGFNNDIRKIFLNSPTSRTSEGGSASAAAAAGTMGGAGTAVNRVEAGMITAEG